MNLKLKSALANTGWLLLAAAGMVLMAAAVSNKNKQVCQSVKIEISGGEDHFFADEREVGKLLNANGKLEGRPLKDINLLVLEKRLENDRWIMNAELFVDNKQNLRVSVEENEPVARIFTVGGYSYYIDSSCKKLPLSDRLSARVPMITGFPSDRTRWSNADSALMASLKDMALYINQNPFWRAQIAQIDINDNRELEVVPTVGSHTVLMGKPAEFENKLNRLFSFYKQVWTKVGLEKYETIDLRFSGQVVAGKKGAARPAIADSSEARKALDEWVASTVKSKNNKQADTNN